MKILITGGAGFIGSNLTDRLLARGDEVLVIDNFATARRDNLTPHPKLTLVEDTIADQAVVDRLFAEFQPDRVVHAAAAYKDPDDWTEDIRTNVLGTANVVRATKNSPATRLIYFQTALCYGLHPIEQPITLTHPIRPEVSYAVSKTAGEQYIQLSGIDYISFRLANVYGPRNISGPLPTFFLRLTSNKRCFAMDTRRDFVYVTDLVNIVMKALDGQGSRGVYHVSTGSDISIKELFDATVAALGITLDYEVEVRPRGADDSYTILLDPSKTYADFDWRAGVPLSEGVNATVAYYQQFGINETFTHLRGRDLKG